MLVKELLFKFLSRSEGRLEDYFQDLEIERILPNLLQYYHHKYHAQNVIWVLQSEVAQLDEKVKDPTTDPAHFTKISPTLSTLQPISVRTLTQLMGDLLRLSGAPCVKNLDREDYFIFPVRNFQTHQVIGSLIVVKAGVNDQDTLLKQISADLVKMERHISFSVQHWNVQNLTTRDDLTGLYNQKYLSQTLDGEIFRSQRENKKFSVLFMDIDFFKSVNDTRGHWIGSRLLVDVAAILKRCIRKSDYAFRYGGDEFVIVLPNTSPEQAMAAAERIRSVIEMTEFLIDGAKLKLTLSIGIATFPDHARTNKEIIQMADEAMYRGKNKSRNIVYVAS